MKTKLLHIKDWALAAGLVSLPALVTVVGGAWWWWRQGQRASGRPTTEEEDAMKMALAQIKQLILMATLVALPVPVALMGGAWGGWR
jgi:hypothetical protein